MKIKSGSFWLLIVAILVLIGGFVWLNASTGSSQASGKKVLCYQDSMHPWVKSDQPGKCTICAMDLTPIYEGEKGFGGGDNLVVLSSNSITVLNVQTDEVKRQKLDCTLPVAGTLEANETRKIIVAAPAPARIEKLNVAYAGVEVEEGQALITLFSPELIQKRGYFRAGTANSQSPGDLYSGTLFAPQSGTVVERPVSAGQYVVEGEKLLTIADASVLWFRFNVYERQLSWITPGQSIDVTVQAVPGKTFPAVIAFVEPTLDDATRTVKVRADIANPIVTVNGHAQRLLRFGMYAEGRVRTDVPDVLAVSRTAILFPGAAAYAYVDKGGGAYERRCVTLGRQGDELWEVLRGLEEGDRVVTSGNVLIDAQAQFNQRAMPDECVIAMASPSSVVEVAHSAVVEAPAAFTPDQLKTLMDFLAVADGISRELAADRLDQLLPYLDKLPVLVLPLASVFHGQPEWSPLIARLTAAASWPVPANLEEARKTFLPFSTATVELVQRVRGQNEAFRSFKVYHCPMAPKPGLWFQAKGPLRNPFYGAQMLTCGDEVQAPAISPALAVAPSVIAEPAAVEPVAALTPEKVAVEAAAPTNGPAAQTASQLPRKPLNYVQMDKARMALKDEMWAMRMAAIAKSHATVPSPTNAAPDCSNAVNSCGGAPTSNAQSPTVIGEVNP